jgi:hypothetical protein
MIRPPRFEPSEEDVESVVLEDDAAVLVALVDHFGQVNDNSPNVGVRDDQASV